MSAAERAASMSPEELIAVIERGLAADEDAAKAWLPFGNPDDAARAHIARHDPGRVLADVESKREILALHPYTTQRRSVGEGRLATMYGRNWEKRLKNLDTPYCETCHVEDGVIDGGGPCDTLIALARPYLTQETPPSAY